MSELVRVSRGVWRPAAEVESHVGRSAALLQSAPAGSVIAGVSAAELHGLWLPDPAGARVELILRRQVAVPRSRAGSTRPEVRGRRRVLHAEDVSTAHGLPVTSIARTWVDLAEHLELPDLVAAGDSALRTGVARAQLAQMVAAGARRRGIVRARTALPLLDGRSRSRPESCLRVGLVLRGLPRPGVNVPIFDDHGQWLGEPDLSFDGPRVAIEYNGADHADPRRMRRDITRELDVSARGGWRVVTVGPTEVFGRMDQLAAYVGELILERSQLCRDGRRFGRVAS